MSSAGFYDCTISFQLGGVLLTHLHMGHYLGLIQFGREAMDLKGVKVGELLHPFVSRESNTLHGNCV